MKGFLLLLSFMTRLPMPNLKYEEEKLGKSMKFFPLVGIIIGFILLVFTLGISYLSKNLTVSVLPLTVIVIILVDIVITGGLHLDGLADTFDGIFSYRSKQKMLEIMKDSRIGSNGVLALILYFLIKFVLLFSIASEYGGEYLMFAVLTYPVASRLCSVVSCASAPYARATGMGKMFADNTKIFDVIIAFVLTVAYIFVSLIDKKIMLINFIIILILIFISYGFSKLIERKIGGITGDTLGALVELTSLLYLFLILYLPSFFLY